MKRYSTYRRRRPKRGKKRKGEVKRTNKKRKVGRREEDESIAVSVHAAHVLWYIACTWLTGNYVNTASRWMLFQVPIPSPRERKSAKWYSDEYRLQSSCFIPCCNWRQRRVNTRIFLQIRHSVIQSSWRIWIEIRHTWASSLNF